ncbi:dihydrolipoyl dehydrogenase [Ktedonobacter sp. SOSP1-85]|uniref:dihydrolipoyl dehydrogenase n=1 Tax=Ktedonobacter sp. SOSP1-85 TaxID=2778367 RepID=UPI001915FEF7|nr:dihydrolipoyl dehydrogenase [Ktedonobacter sp. SOSP1-85]GHO75690.1 dihydrolipoyl dehydrogenase [Ktedonobacter sp. SOSP1-85]
MVVGDVTTAVDVLVLGAGPGGYVAAIRAAQCGHHVTLIDPGAAGGTCLNRGCIPLKALLSASERYSQSQASELAPFGIHVETTTFDWSTMQGWKEGVVARLSNGVRQLLTGNRVEMVTGTGWFINEREVRVEGVHGSHRFKFDHCIIATGAVPATVAGLEYDGREILSPEQALALPQLPERLAISGDDYIALELATVFARLGTHVTLYTPGEQLLASAEPALLRLLQAGLRKQSIQVKSRVDPTTITERPLVLAAGVAPRVQDLHLEAAGVRLNEHGGIAVDSMLKTSTERIYAVGDCTGASPLASVAMKQGKVAAEVLSGQRVQFAPLAIPRVVHTQPEFASVGYTLEEATQAGYKVKSARFPLAANGRALTLNADNGAVFVIASADDEVLLGATLVGTRAGDLIGQVALALEMGATLTDLSEILYAHPGLSETLLESAEGALGHAIHMLNKNA